MLIYKIVHLDSNNKYIGQTTRAPIKRWQEHLRSLRKNKHSNRYLQAAWNKYGESAFKFEIVKEFNDLQELNKAEIELIKNGSDLFNLTEGGNAFIHKSKTNKKIGKINKIPIIGMNIDTGEVRNYGSATDAAKDGFNQSCVRKCALRSVSKRKNGSTFRTISHKGWVWTEDIVNYKEKLLELVYLAKRSKIRTERPVIGASIVDGTVLSFVSVSAAARSGFQINTIVACCRDRVKIHKGYVWIYDDHVKSQSLLQEKLMRIRSKLPSRGPRSWA